MSDDFVGFEEDDDVQKPIAKKPVAAETKPAFDPFADVAVDTSVESSAAAPTETPAPEPEKKFDAFAGEKTDEDAVDPNLKPGHAKDLWKCPHCGAGNKPGRDTCRSCGKQQDEEVVVPFLEKPGVKPGLLAAIVIIVALVLMNALSVDWSLRVPSAANCDASITQEQAGGADISLDNGTTFTVAGRIAFCGRIESAGSHKGNRYIKVIVDTHAADDSWFKNAKIDAKKDTVVYKTNPTPAPFAVVTLLPAEGGSIPACSKGAWVSVSAPYGSSDKLESDPSRSRFIVAIEDGTIAVE